MKNKKRALSLFLISLLVFGMTLMTACSKKATNVSNLDPKTSLVLTVSDKQLYLNELMYYIYAVEAEGDYYDQMYQQYFGSSYWDMEYSEGVTMREQTKQYVIDTVIMYEILNDKAVAAGYTLTEEEIANATENAEAIMADISEEQKTITGFTTELLSGIQQKLLLGEKYYNEIMEGLNIDKDAITATVKYEDYKQYDTEYLSILTSTYDDENNPVTLSKEEIEEARKTMASALEKAKAGDDFTAIEEAISGVTASELSFIYGDGTIDTKYQDAAIKLADGETTSEVIETEDGLYIIKLTASDSKESYDAAVEEAIATEEDKQFTAAYDEILKDYTTKVNDSVWNNITMGTTTIKASEADSEK